MIDRLPPERDARYAHRLGLDALEALYPSAEAALAAGDYGWVARYADTDSEPRGIALILLGNAHGGLGILSRLADPGPRARMFMALGRWLADGRAIDTKELPGGEVVRRLADLAAERPRKVLVLSNLQEGKKKSVSQKGLVELWNQVPGFEVHTAWFFGEEAEIRLSMAQGLAEVPDPGSYDLVIHYQFEHLTPVGLEVFECPVVAVAFDPEPNIAEPAAQYRHYDAIVATSSQTHRELSIIGGPPCFVSLALLSPFPETKIPAGGSDDEIRLAMAAHQTEKSFDLLYSGAISNEDGYYLDKPWRLTRIGRMKDVSKLICDGYLPFDA